MSNVNQVENQVEKKRTVYAVNLSDKNYKSAEQYGNLVFMTRGILDLRKHEASKDLMLKYFEDSNEDDYLLLSGPMLICAIALKLWMDIHEKCNVLYFNPRGGYVLYEIKNDAIDADQ